MSERKEKKHFEGHRERLREKFIKTDCEDLQEYEVLEFLLTYVVPRRDVKPLAKKLLEKFRDISGVLDANYEEINIFAKEYKGLGDGERFFALLKLVRDMNILCQRNVACKEFDGHKFDTVTKVGSYLIQKIGHEKDEKFLVLFLNNALKLIEEDGTLSFEGTIDQVPILPRKIAEKALLVKARGVILAHNHPSQNVTPSQDDIGTTKTIAKGLKTLGIELFDHIIVSKTDYFSFRKEGMLTNI